MIKICPFVASLSALSATVLGLFSLFFLSFLEKDTEPQRVHLMDLVSKRAWEEYKDHVSNCEVCSSVDECEKFKMCSYSYYLSNAAKPFITNDQLRLIAEGKLVIFMD